MKRTLLNLFTVAVIIAMVVPSSTIAMATHDSPAAGPAQSSVPGKPNVSIGQETRPGFAPGQDAATARVAVAHLAPFANTLAGTAVTVTLDSTPVLTNFVYGASTGYLPVPAGSHLVAIYPMGSATPAITANVTLSENLSYSAVAIGDGVNQPLSLLARLDDTTPISGSAKVRIGHLAPFASTITGTLADVRLQDGTPIATNVPFGEVASYLTLPAGTYDLKITAPGGYPTLIDPLPVTLHSNDILSVFATGDGAKQKLGVFAWPSNQAGSFLPLGAQLAVAHLAPFAAGAGTSVTVTLDSTPVLTNFVYGASTGYLPVPEGSHLVEIFPVGSATPAITGSVNLVQAQSYSAIAIGDGVNQPLSLLALPDVTTPISGSARVRIGHLAPFSTTITGTLADVRLQDGTPITTNVPFGAVASYVTLPAGTYALKITAPGGYPTLIEPLPVTLHSNDILSVFATGDVANQKLGVFAWPSNQAGSFLPLLKSRIYLPVIFR